MEKFRRYSFNGIYEEGGFSASFSLPDDCRKVVGVYFLPQLPDMPAPDGKAFLIGKMSVLLNNKTENSLHDYALMAYPDANGKMSLGDDYAYHNKHVELNTETKKGNVITFVFKDSGHMTSYIAADSVTYGAYNPSIDIYIVYEDERGDWSNNEFDRKLRLLLKDD
jgi:hypothetical protein